MCSTVPHSNFSLSTRFVIRDTRKGELCPDSSFIEYQPLNSDMAVRDYGGTTLPQQELTGLALLHLLQHQLLSRVLGNMLGKVPVSVSSRIRGGIFMLCEQNHLATTGMNVLHVTLMTGWT